MRQIHNFWVGSFLSGRVLLLENRQRIASAFAVDIVNIYGIYIYECVGGRGGVCRITQLFGSMTLMIIKSRTEPFHG